MTRLYFIKESAKYIIPDHNSPVTYKINYLRLLTYHVIKMSLILHLTLIIYGSAHFGKLKSDMADNGNILLLKHHFHD